MKLSLHLVMRRRDDLFNAIEKTTYLRRFLNFIANREAGTAVPNRRALAPGSGTGPGVVSFRFTRSSPTKLLSEVPLRKVNEFDTCVAVNE